MRTGKTRGLLIGGAILLVLVIWFATTYNGLVAKQEKVQQTWSDVQSVYQRRLDLVPNLVSVVKGNADFESSTLEEIANARSNAQAVQTTASFGESSFQQQSAAQDQLASATNRLLIRVEKYPVLKGTAAFRGLQTQLEGTERRIKVARNDFNGAVNTYNSAVRSFPSSIAAKITGFKTREGFAATAGAENAVEIKF